MYQPRSIPKTFQKKEEGTPSAHNAGSGVKRILGSLIMVEALNSDG